jgi:hypothetical protein
VGTCKTATTTDGHAENKGKNIHTSMHGFDNAINCSTGNLSNISYLMKTHEKNMNKHIVQTQKRLIGICGPANCKLQSNKTASAMAGLFPNKIDFF